MGTTLTDLTSGESIAWDVVIAIEGYGNLLTTGSTAAAITAWAGTDWSAALGGLAVTHWNLRSKLDPWEPFTNESSLTFSVMDVDSAYADTFGIDTHRKEGGTTSPLATSLDPNDASLVVLRSDDFAASGTLYVGAEAIAYSTNTTATSRQRSSATTPARARSTRCAAVAAGACPVRRRSTCRRSWPAAMRASC